MPKSPVERTYYEISGSQLLPLWQLRVSIHKECTQIVFYTIINQKFDAELLKRAMNEEIARNDCMRIRFERHDKKLMQYFMPEYKLENIPFLDFTGKTKEEQDAVLSEDAHKPLRIMKGETFRAIFYRTYDGRTGIYLNISHLVADLCAVVITLGDLLEVISALQNKTPMTKPLATFEECLKKDIKIFSDPEEIAKHKEFFKEYFTKDGPSFYASPDGGRMLNQTRRKKKDPAARYVVTNLFMKDKSENYGRYLSAERATPILAFCEKNNLPLQTMVYVAMRTYCSKINEGTDDVTFSVAFNRRITLADKRSGGCRVNALPLRTVIPKDKTFMQAITQTQEIQYQILRHTEFLFTLNQREIKAMENRPMLSNTFSMLLTCLPLSISLPEGWQCEFGNYSNGRFMLPLYTVVVPNLIEGGLDFRFEHQVDTLYREELDALFEQSVKIMEAGIANPDITIGELMHEIPEAVAQKDITPAAL